jgi:hypothetical protein
VIIDSALLTLKSRSEKYTYSPVLLTFETN